MPSIIFFILLAISVVRSEYKYETKWFRVPLDHFAFERNETFEIKYLVNEDYWDRDNGPIFFYTGNEGQIEHFAKHTGFMWEIAPEFQAKIVFAEQRYYGASMPFDNNSLDIEHIGYLSSAQALADYAELVIHLQDNAINPKYPVIAFGGSYGGMLAAYFRIKDPHLVDGAIAASAPVHMFQGMVPCGTYKRIVTSNYENVTTNCSDNIRRSWSVIRNYSSTSEGSDFIQKAFNLCSPLTNTTDLETLIKYVTNMYCIMAMVNYPFPADFLTSLPAEPVRVVCQYLNESLAGDELLQSIGKVIDVYSNYEKKSNCIDYLKGHDLGDLDASGWSFQACTEMVFPICSDGKYDMFELKPWNFTTFAEKCYKKFNVYPRLEMARIEYGGDSLQAASNIVFSNGRRDPWSGGGILESLSDTVVATVIEDAAHHLDLMPSSPNDPEPLKTARETHKRHITKWINQFHENMKSVTFA